jgi:hypothetical protein
MLTGGDEEVANKELDVELVANSNDQKLNNNLFLKNSKEVN